MNNDMVQVFVVFLARKNPVLGFLRLHIDTVQHCLALSRQKLKKHDKMHMQINGCDPTFSVDKCVFGCIQKGECVDMVQDLILRIWTGVRLRS